MAIAWYPSWWSDFHGSAWDRVKEAMRRDWEQTKFDLNLPGGHELNQGVMDTVDQAAGMKAIPVNDKPNPPKVIGSWEDVELPMGYGYGARQKYGAQHPAWDDSVEAALRLEWESAKDKPQYRWDDVKGWVRRGYQYEARQ